MRFTKRWLANCGDLSQLSFLVNPPMGRRVDPRAWNLRMLSVFSDPETGSNRRFSYRAERRSTPQVVLQVAVSKPSVNQLISARIVRCGTVAGVAGKGIAPLTLVASHQARQPSH